MRALITGIGGQDGSYLAEHLLELGDEVFGILRRQSVAENQDYRIRHLQDRITTFYGDLLDPVSIYRILDEVRPDEVYNLASQSQVRISVDMPVFTAQVNAIGPMILLDAVKRIVPNARYYQASSSEMFGNSIDDDGFQRITTPMRPVSPYGCAKLMAFNMTKYYREGLGLRACNGVLFNHTSPRRGSNFVEAKIVKKAVEISKGLADKLVLGNIQGKRDWGHAHDYVRAMVEILRAVTMDDWVAATGKTYSVYDIVKYVFSALNIPMTCLDTANKFQRPIPIRALRGDSAPIREILGWAPIYTLWDVLDEMIGYWQQRIEV